MDLSDLVRLSWAPEDHAGLASVLGGRMGLVKGLVGLMNPAQVLVDLVGLASDLADLVRLSWTLEGPAGLASVLGGLVRLVSDFVGLMDAA